MGILFISITAGFVVLIFIVIVLLRKNKTRNNPSGPGSRSVVEEKKTGKEKGIYD